MKMKYVFVSLMTLLLLSSIGFAFSDTDPKIPQPVFEQL